MIDYPEAPEAIWRVGRNPVEVRQEQREADAAFVQEFGCNCDERELPRPEGMRENGEHWEDCPQAIAAAIRSQP